MKLAYLAFSETGYALAERLSQALGGTAARCGGAVKLEDWTARWFDRADGLVFVGAAGIAVRAIAPFLKSKTADPAVVAVDECGRYAVSLLSGHLGGANDLARSVAAVCGAEPVITTATDLHGVFAVDEWANHQNCHVANPERIKRVSSSLLAGGTVGVYSPWPVNGVLPRGVEPAEAEICGVCVDIRCSSPNALWLVPRILVLGIGCRKGTGAETLETAFADLLERTGIHEKAVSMAASIDLKRDEPGIRTFCEKHGWPCRTYSGSELADVSGEFTSSEFVSRVTGVDNVCERSAVLASGGTLIQKKLAAHGVTMALAEKPYHPDWRWRNG